MIAGVSTAVHPRTLCFQIRFPLGCPKRKYMHLNELSQSRVLWCFCMSYFSIVLTKSLTRSNLREKGFVWDYSPKRTHLSWREDTVTGRGSSCRSGDLGATLHLCRHRRENTSRQFAFSVLVSGGSEPVEWCHPPLGCVLPSQPPTSRKSPLDTTWDLPTRWS